MLWRHDAPIHASHEEDALPTFHPELIAVASGFDRGMYDSLETDDALQGDLPLDDANTDGRRG